MKQLEIKTNKRLLIVEGNEIELSKEGIIYKDQNSHVSDLLEGDFKLICKGSELTEDIAKGLVEVKRIKNVWDDFMSDVYINYQHTEGLIDQYTTSSLESFISAIQSKNYHWGENPVKFNENEINWEKRHKNRIDWERAELITFNPSKCIIFEIL